MWWTKVKVKSKWEAIILLPLILTGLLFTLLIAIFLVVVFLSAVLGVEFS